MSYCSRSRRRRFTVLNFKSAFSRICGHCLQHFTAHMQKRLFRNFQQKFLQFGDVFRWFLHFICWMSFDSPTPICLQCAKFRQFGDVFHRFLHFITWKFAVFMHLALFLALYLLRQVQSWYVHPLPSYCVLAAVALRDLVTLTFDLMTLTRSCTWQVTWSTLPKS